MAFPKKQMLSVFSDSIYVLLQGAFSPICYVMADGRNEGEVGFILVMRVWRSFIMLIRRGWTRCVLDQLGGTERLKSGLWNETRVYLCLSMVPKARYPGLG